MQDCLFIAMNYRKNIKKPVQENMEQKVKISKEGEKQSAVLALLAMVSCHSHLTSQGNVKCHTSPNCSKIQKLSNKKKIQFAF